MKYEMQIRIEDPQDSSKKVWKSVRQSPFVAPYQYETKLEAERMLRLCYQGSVMQEDMRVISVENSLEQDGEL